MSTHVPCPSCDASGLPGCVLCDGAAVVARTRAENYHVCCRIVATMRQAGRDPMHVETRRTYGLTARQAAALVDGAGTWDLFWRIHVPLARAPIASLGILMSVWAWNQFLLALVLVEDPTQRTMAGALGAFQGHYATDIPLLCAGTVLILLPTFLIFILFQRQVISALLQGSVKG